MRCPSVSAGMGKLFQVIVLENDGSDFIRPPTIFIQAQNMDDEATAKMMPCGSTAP